MDTVVHTCFTLTNFLSRFVFWSYPSDDRLWHETLSYGDSEFSRVLAIAKDLYQYSLPVSVCVGIFPNTRVSGTDMYGATLTLIQRGVGGGVGEGL